MRFNLIWCLLVPALSFSQDLVKVADSVRLTRGIPGMVFAVFTSDSILVQGAVGYRKYRTKDSIKINDRFDIGTNAAAFTAYIAGKMVESGKISWNTKLLDVYPDFKGKILPVYEELTLSSLLSNQTRLPAFSRMEEQFKIPYIEAATLSASRRQIALFMLQQKPNMENTSPDKKPFSISGFMVATSMLEKVSGKKWENLVLQYVNNPLKISVKYGWPNLVDSAQPAGHWYQSNYFHAEEPTTWLKPNQLLFPAHDINISLPDYVIFMQENLRSLAGKKSWLDQDDMNYIHYGVMDYSMGWHNGVLNNYSFSFQEGQSILFDCRVEVLKEKNIAIIVMCNSGENDARGGVLNLTRILESYALSH